MPKFLSLIQNIFADYNYISVDLSKIFKLDIPKEVSFDGMQDIIRKHLNDPKFQLDIEGYKAWLENNKNEEKEREFLISSLGKFYEMYKDKDDPESLKKRNELQDLVYYMRFSTQKMELVEVSESPDFIVKLDGERIGIEHTGIYDPEVVEDISIQEKLCRLAEKQLKQDTSLKKTLFNVKFDQHFFSSKTKKPSHLELAEYLRSYLLNPDMEHPPFISKTIATPHTHLQVKVSEEYELKNVNPKVIDELIAQKEAKIQDYRANSGTTKQWLLIILEGSSAKTNVNITPELLPQRPTLFDKVIVFDTFKSIGIESKK